MTSLVVGTLLAIAALLLVLEPLLSGRNVGQSPEPDPQGSDARGADSDAEGSAIAALREIEFDRETGKLSDADYADLKQRYTRAAIDEMRGEDAVVETSNNASIIAAAASTRSIDAAVDAAIARARASRPSCNDCGPRPEVDAMYCSNCGKHLQSVCARCNASVVAVDSAFCASCGASLRS
jgi:rRNA maturation endonuclease Nob1